MLLLSRQRRLFRLFGMHLNLYQAQINLPTSLVGVLKCAVQVLQSCFWTKYLYIPLRRLKVIILKWPIPLANFYNLSHTQCSQKWQILKKKKIANSPKKWPILLKNGQSRKSARGISHFKITTFSHQGVHQMIRYTYLLYFISSSFQEIAPSPALLPSLAGSLDDADSFYANFKHTTFEKISIPHLLWNINSFTSADFTCFCMK